jgi:hypothetical protein
LAFFANELAGKEPPMHTSPPSIARGGKEMTEEEFAIVEFLKLSPATYFSRREIARKAVRRDVYEQNQHWADTHLAALLAKELIEQNVAGLYKLKTEDILSL